MPCNKTKVPYLIKEYLGLGLKFCPNLPESSNSNKIDIQRFHDDYCHYIFFSTGSTKDDFKKPALYVLSGCIPEIKETYWDCFQKFKRALKNHFQARKVPSNLSSLRKRAQQWLLAHLEVTVLNGDKNLGRKDYIKFAHKDHLQDCKSYKCLPEALKNKPLANTFHKIHKFCEIWTKKKVISKMDAKYIYQNTEAKPAYVTPSKDPQEPSQDPTYHIL